MPRLDNSMQGYKLGGNFTFTAKRIEKLGATEYTLVTIALDESGSVDGFETELRAMLVQAVESCKRSPRSDNLLVRVLYFSSKYPKGVSEIHGFKPLSEIDTNAYPVPSPGGITPLCDATYSGIGAMNAYGKDLFAQDYLANGIGFVITDGGENASTATMDMVKQEFKKAVSGECLESLVSVLIGVNADMCRPLLEKFSRDAGFDKYIDAGDANERNLAKLAAFVSQSVSSQSQSIGTGGPSQQIAATI
jgi:uncharacterized protein YegL